MKRLRLVVIALFALVTVGSVNAQDSNNPWTVGFGMNIVDFRVGDGFENIAKDYFGRDDWNTSNFLSRVTAGKYLDKGFSLEAVFSFNEIKTLDAIRDVELQYYSLDLNVKYDLNELFGDTSWFDPYVLVGGSFVYLDGDQKLREGMLNIGWGANFWVGENFGINYQAVAKKEFADEIQDHFQHSIGVVFRFGGKDTDGDGIYDKDDACPETAGLTEFNGCPDSDGDGIKDGDDSCPNVTGLAALNGCPDADADGIADKDDMCSNDKGTKANNGCPDTDGDGLVDKDDRCATVAGPSDNGGCPWPDTDGDGVLDKDDNCKNEVGPASNNGCPEPVISDVAEKKIGEFAKTILFNSSRAKFKAGGSDKLDGIVKLMNEFPKATFVVEGHADNTGSVSFNEKLSVKRATTVKDYLVKNGVDGSRLTTKGYGMARPIDTNDTRAGRANNRRVEIKVTNE